MRFLLTILVVAFSMLLPVDASAKPRAVAAQMDIRAMTPDERMNYVAKTGNYMPPGKAQTGNIRTAPLQQHYDSTVIGGMPAACERWVATIPQIRWKFCGCAVADYVGLDNSDGFFNLAGHFGVLARAAPANGMVAYNRHHVVALISHVEGRRWLAYDPNSGGRLTRIHVVDIGRYRVVSPHARTASR